MIPPQELDDDQFERARGLVYKATGNRVGDGKRTLLGNRLKRRMRALGHADFETYLAYLASPAGRAELGDFVDAVTTNETYFFRNPEQYEWFGGEFLRDFSLASRGRPGPRRLRVWSAACSTGEEPCSIAICLLENQLRLQDVQLQVVGTDICGEVLEKARAGLYKDRALELVDEKRRRRYFVREDAGWRVRPQVAGLVTFRRHNLIERLDEEPFDCIFLKNVLIYFDAASKKKVVDSLKRALAPGGHLVLGPCEGVYDMLDFLEPRRAWLFRRPAGAH